jgi:hypothetical protein
VVCPHWGASSAPYRDPVLDGPGISPRSRLMAAFHPDHRFWGISTLTHARQWGIQRTSRCAGRHRGRAGYKRHLPCRVTLFNGVAVQGTNKRGSKSGPVPFPNSLRSGPRVPTLRTERSTGDRPKNINLRGLGSDLRHLVFAGKPGSRAKGELYGMAPDTAITVFCNLETLAMGTTRHMAFPQPI